MTQRTDRIDELLRQEIGRAIESELADPGIGFVTVTRVETSPDLSHARVWVSVIGSEAQRKETLAALRRAMPYIRRGLNDKVRLRRIPELEFRFDDSVVRGTRVLQILSELEAGRTPDEPASKTESLPTPVGRLPHEGDTYVPEPPPEAAPQKPRSRRKFTPGRGPRNGAGPGSRPSPKRARDDSRGGSS